MNIGKVFEAQIQKSVPEYAKMYRLSDSAQSFGKSSNLRFSNKNPFDYFLWDSNNRNLYTLELKTVSGKSISFERNSDDKGEIHYHQINGLDEWSKFNGVISGFIIEFREIETTVFIHIKDFKHLLDVIDKKSFNYKDLHNYSIPFIKIPQTKLRTRYLYDLDFLLKQMVS